jgi:Flp pilus assembly protein TadD/cell division protein FtsN
MNTTNLAKIAASALALGFSVSTISPVASDVQAAPANPELSAARYANKASKLIASPKADKAKAVAAAEKAVAYSPNNVEYRYILARAYLASGRLSAAETSFNDVLVLQPSHTGAGLKLALMKAARGDNGAAIAAIEGMRESIPAADFGLALALAGDVPGAISTLEAAARSPGADARIRQNLALSYAFANRWSEARVVASQDLAPELVGERLASWAKLAHPTTSWDQVAGVLGVRPVYDPGQPQQLALNVRAADAPALADASAPPPAPVAPVRIVEASADVASAPVFELPTATAAAEASNVQLAEAEPASPAEAPLIKAYPTPAKQIIVPVARTVAEPKAKATPAVAVRGVESGKYVVQLGAYASSSQSEAAWNRMARAIAPLQGFSPVGAKVKVNGSNFYRLSVTGFATRDSAGQLCTKVKAEGGNCFIRSVAGDTPIQWARRSGGNTKVAIRKAGGNIKLAARR